MKRGFNYYGELLEKFFVSAFYNYGIFVGRHPGKILMASLLLVVISLPGFFYVRINLDLYKLFVPLDADVRTEFERQQEFNRIPLGNLDVVPPPRVPKSIYNNVTGTALTEYEENFVDRSKRGLTLIFFSSSFKILMF